MTQRSHVFWKRQLERWGYEVFDTVDFDRVMENFAKWKPDLVLMDLTLPFSMAITGAVRYEK